MVNTLLHTPGVYAITSSACGRVYVGSTIDLRTRWKQHRSDLRRGVHATPKLQTAWSLYGASNFSFSVLEDISDKASLRVREQFWLDSLDAAERGFNVLHLVDPYAPWSMERRAALSKKRMGHHVSEETREKLRQANLGKKTHSPESLAKLRAWNLGKKMSPEAIARTAASWTGRKHSPSSREKMSESTKAMYANGVQHPWKGRKHSPDTIEKLKGKRRSQETKDKLSQTRKAMFATGYVGWWKGKKHSPETVAKLKARPISQDLRDKISRGRKAYFAKLRGE